MKSSSIAIAAAFLIATGPGLARVLCQGNPVKTPIVVHGGSMILSAPDDLDWRQPDAARYPNVWSADIGKPLDSLSLEGISASAVRPFSPTPLSIDQISTNWIITFDFRLKGSAEDVNTRSQICSSWSPNGGCTTTGTPGTTLWFIGNLDRNLARRKSCLRVKTPTFDISSSIDTKRARYDVYCNWSHSKNSDCNHIYRVTVSSVTGSVSGGSSAQQPEQTYRCVDGACGVTIDPQF